ncbi:MAG: LemA family protein [Candidatus Absconditicoccaceae bacterium]
MKKTRLIIVGIIVVIILLLAGKYNKLVSLDESTKTARSQVENVYQRRLDLIPNLVNTVKGFAAQEQQVLLGVTNARASATKVNVNVNDAKEFADFQSSQTELSSALSRLLMVTENYPDLKSNQNFLELQAQLEGTENRITVERKNFNDTAKVYNIYVRSFPNNIVAGIMGFSQTNLFEANEGAENAPVVDFAPTVQE